MSLSDVFYNEEPLNLQAEEEAPADGGDELTEAQEEYVEEQAEEVFDDLEDKDANEAVAEWQALKELSGLAMASPMMSHITMSMIAGSFALSGFMEGLRYRTDVTVSGVTAKYYAGGVVDGSSNFWELSQMIRNWTFLGVGATLMVTSLLAAFGIMTGLNAMLWALLGFGAAIATMVVNVIRWWGYFTYYGKGKKIADTHFAAAQGAMSAIFWEAMQDGAMMVAAYIGMASSYEGFYYDMWMRATEEEQDEKYKAWEETISTRAGEIADKREADGLDKEKAEKEEKEEEEGEEDAEGEGEEGADEGEEEGEEEAADK